MPEIFYWKALNRALDEELGRDQRVIVFGEDVALPGGVFGVTRNLAAKYGAERVFDAPIAENAFVGAAVGAAMAGLRPVCELMFMDFSLVAADQIINHAAKVRYLTQGAFSAPMVIRAQQGVTPGSSAQHTQSLEAMFAAVPGLRVVAAATPADAYGMLKSAIRCPDPVLFLEHRRLYTTKGEVHAEEHTLPIDKARVVREGGDLTILSWLGAVSWAEEIAERLGEQGISLEVIDLRSLSPIDYATIGTSIRKTGRAAILHEAIRTGGLGGEISASLSEQFSDSLRGPVTRYGAESVPVPSAPILQEATQPRLDQIAAELAASFSSAVPTSAGER